jgi:hypothetical protein
MLAASATAPGGFDWGTFWAYAAVILAVGGGLAAWITSSVSRLRDRLEPRLGDVERSMRDTQAELATVVTDVMVLRDSSARTESTLSSVNVRLDSVGSATDRMYGQLDVLIGALGDRRRGPSVEALPPRPEVIEPEVIEGNEESGPRETGGGESEGSGGQSR